MTVTPTNIPVSSSVPALNLAAGSVGGVAVANSIDAVQDYLLIYQHSSTSTLGINRNTLLGLSSAPVGLTDSQTMTNKILTSPTISGPTLSGTVIGTYTIGGTPTFPSSVVTLTGSQTLTNKTLTSPTINAPSITNATITADSLAGFTTSNNGTVYGISVTGGTIGSAALAANSVTTAAIATNAVTAPKLATNAIQLGYAQITGNLTTQSTSIIQAAGLTTTVTIPAGGRSIKITAFCSFLTNGTASKNCIMSIWDGTVGSGTQLQGTTILATANGDGQQVTLIAVVTPSAGSKTYNVGYASDPNGSVTTTYAASSTTPGFILVEAI